MKFDRFENTKKPTGSAVRPPFVRKTKDISRNILGRVNAKSVGDEAQSPRSEGRGDRSGTPNRNEEKKH